MRNTYVDYASLLNRFLAGALDADEFQRLYLTRFKHETVALGEPVFELLDALFGDVAAFTSDPQLLALNCGLHLDEPALRRKVAAAARRLAELDGA